MGPIVEFVWWSATDEYLKDFHSRVKPTLNYVQNADGCTRLDLLDVIKIH